MYFYEKIDNNHEVRGIYQDIVDCVYIITMKNNTKRRKLFLMNFMNRNFTKIIGPIVCMVGSDLEKIKKYYKYQVIV